MKLGGEWTLIESAEVTRARSALAAESRFVNALLDAAAVLVVTVDADGRVIRCNSRCEGFTGHSRGEIEGRPVWESIDLPRDRILATIGECLEAGGARNFEARVPRCDGQERIFAWSTAGVCDREGELNCLVVTGQDITEHREAQHRLQEAYELEHRVAKTLQESLLSPVPDLPGLRLGVVYKPAFEAERVGGDFYDIFPLAEDRVALIVGDISGKGVSAAGLTETVRSTMRALLHMGLAPDDALSQAGRVLLNQTRGDQFATLGVAVLDRDTGEVLYSSAGHPPPIIQGSSSRYVDVPQGVPLGTFEWTYEMTSIELRSPECLIMYTDGLSEARRDGRLFGEDDLLVAAGALGPDPGALVAGLLDEAQAFAGGPLGDDVAIVAFQPHD